MATQLDRIEQMLNALCNHLGVRDATSAPISGTDNGGAEAGRRYTGVVSRFDHGWGFIACEALGRQFFVYHRDVEGTGLRTLEAGAEVSFEVGEGKNGRPKAVRVRRQSANGSVAQPPQVLEVLPSEEASRNGDGASASDDADDSDDGMPQPESSAGDLLRSASRRAAAKRTGPTTAVRRRRSPHLS